MLCLQFSSFDPSLLLTENLLFLYIVRNLSVNRLNCLTLPSFWFKLLALYRPAMASQSALYHQTIASLSALYHRNMASLSVLYHRTLVSLSALYHRILASLSAYTIGIWRDHLLVLHRYVFKDGVIIFANKFA